MKNPILKFTLQIIQPMKSMKTRLVLVLFILGVLIAPAALAQSANNKPPGKMTFQGFLTDSSGNPLGQTGPTNLTVFFRLYKSAQGADKIWAEQQVVTIDRGHFSVLLGEGTATGVAGDPVNSADLGQFFVGSDASDRFLSIQVSGQSEVAPRIQFFAAPYAHLAQYANNLVSPGGASILNASLNGNIGIGTGSPDRKLQIGDDTINASEAMLRFESRSPAGGMQRAWDIGVPAGVESSTGKSFSFVIDDVAAGTGPEFMVKWGTGFVGIGTTNPASMLDVNGTVTAPNFNGSFTGNGSGLSQLNAANLTGTIHSDRLPGIINGDKTFTGNIGVNYSRKLDLSVGAARADANNGVIGTAIYTANALDIIGGGTGDFNSRRIIFHSQAGSLHWGSIGINRLPRCPIDIGAYNSMIVPGYGYLHAGGTGFHNPGTTLIRYSLLADERIGCPEFNAFSDRRIKDVIGPSDTKSDLALIRQLRVTDYRSKDAIGEGNRLLKGFIAQEVEELIPEAVSKTTNWIPNIYTLAAEAKADTGRQQLALTMTNAHGLKVGDRVRLITEAGRFDVPVSSVLETNKFVVSEWTNSVQKVFVFGKEADDFRTLNYDRIFSTGIGAIQELAGRLEEKSDQVRALEKKVADLEKMVLKLAGIQEGKGRADAHAQDANLKIAAK